MNDFKPTTPTLKHLSRINCYEANHDRIACSIADIIINPWNKDLAEPFKKVRTIIFNILETNTNKGIENFVQKCGDYSKTGYQFIPRNLAKKIATEIKDIDEANKWTKDVLFFISPEGKVYEKEYKDNVLKIKDFIQRIKYHASPTIQVENPSFKGITGACERDRTSHFTRKSAQIIKDFQEALIDRIHNKLPEVNYFISRNNELNCPETNHLLGFVAYFQHREFDEFVLNKSFVDMFRR